MPEKICKICGKQFFTPTNGVYCSAECRKNADNRRSHDVTYMKKPKKRMPSLPKQTLPIPGFPDHVITPDLKVFNKRRKKFLKLYQRASGCPCYVLTHNGRRILWSPKRIRRFAVAAAVPDTFEPIPSLGGKYEINKCGIVRNSQSKQIIHPHRNSVQFRVSKAGDKYIRTVPDLLWEVHGIIIKERHRLQPVWAENSKGKFFFTNIAECARFLVGKIAYALNTIQVYLWRRYTTIADWKFTYPPPEDFEPLNAMAKTNKLARHQKWAEASLCAH